MMHFCAMNLLFGECSLQIPRVHGLADPPNRVFLVLWGSPQPALRCLGCLCTKLDKNTLVKLLKNTSTHSDMRIVMSNAGFGQFCRGTQYCRGTSQDSGIIRVSCSLRSLLNPPGLRKESRAGVAAPPVVGDGLFWKFNLFGDL